MAISSIRFRSFEPGLAMSQPSSSNNATKVVPMPPEPPITKARFVATVLYEARCSVTDKFQNSPRNSIDAECIYLRCGDGPLAGILNLRNARLAKSSN